MSLASELGKLKELKDSGAITQQVFEQLRNRLLDECVRRIEALHDQKPLIRAAQEPAPVVADAVPVIAAASQRTDVRPTAVAAPESGAETNASQRKVEDNEATGSRASVPYLGWELPPVKVVHGTVQHLRFLPAEPESTVGGTQAEISLPTPLRPAAAAGVEIIASTTLQAVTATRVERVTTEHSEAAPAPEPVRAFEPQSAVVSAVGANTTAMQHTRAVPRLDFSASSALPAQTGKHIVPTVAAHAEAETATEGVSAPTESIVDGVGMSAGLATMAASGEGALSLAAGAGSSGEICSPWSETPPLTISAAAGAGSRWEPSFIAVAEIEAASEQSVDEDIAEDSAIPVQERNGVCDKAAVSAVPAIAVPAAVGASSGKGPVAAASVEIAVTSAKPGGVLPGRESSAPRVMETIATPAMNLSVGSPVTASVPAEAEAPKNQGADNCHLFESFYQRKPPVWARWGLPPVKVVRGVARNVRFSNDDDATYAASLEVDGQRVEIDSSSSIGIDVGDHLTLGGYEREGKLLALAYHNDSKGAHSDLRRLRRGYRFLFTIGWTSLLAGLGAVAGTVILLILRQRVGTFDSGMWGIAPYALSGLAAVVVSYFGLGLSFLGARAKEFHDAMNPRRAWQK